MPQASDQVMNSHHRIHNRQTFTMREFQVDEKIVKFKELPAAPAGVWAMVSRFPTMKCTQMIRQLNGSEKNPSAEIAMKHVPIVLRGSPAVPFAWLVRESAFRIRFETGLENGLFIYAAMS